MDSQFNSQYATASSSSSSAIELAHLAHCHFLSSKENHLGERQRWGSSAETIFCQLHTKFPRKLSWSQTHDQTAVIIVITVIIIVITLTMYQVSMIPPLIKYVPFLMIMQMRRRKRKSN